MDSRVYTWNKGGRLTNHTSSLTGQNQADGYNAAGARVSSVPIVGQPATTYRRAGMGVLAPVLSEWKSGAQVAAYTPGVSEKRGTVSTWSHGGIKNFDYQSKSNSTVSSARRYDAFGDGQTQVSGSFWRGPWGYGGPFGYYSTNYGPQAIGMEAGYTPTEPIKQVGHRWYDPSIGRFLSRDPAQSGRNWFSYCENDPINTADPSGLEERALTKDQNVKMQGGINRLKADGYGKEADHLQELLNAGKIKYDDKLDAYAEERWGHIIVGEKFFRLYEAPTSPRVRAQGLLAGLISASSVLLHEEVHTRQGGLKNGFTINAREREAYRKQIKYLRRLLGSSSLSTKPFTKSELEGFLDGMIDNENGYHGWP